MPSWAVSKKGGIAVEDLIIHGKFTGTITRVEQKKIYDGQDGIVIEFRESQKPFVPCLTVRKLLAAFMPKELDKWPGIRLELFADQSVQFGGQKVGGVRLSAASCLTAPFSMSVCAARGRRAIITVMPLQQQKLEKQTPPEQKK